MIRKWFSIFILMSIGTLLLTVPSCGDPQELVSITIQPTNLTIGASTIPVAADAGYKVQLTALGSYLHPPVTKDITDQVNWLSTDLQMFTIDSSGLLIATGRSCGTALISAALQTNADASGVSSSGAVVTGYMTAGVTCFTGTSGGGGAAEPTISVTFAGTGSGTITSSPLGLSCVSTATSCAASFPTGTDVTLTATPVSGTFGGWSGCSLVSGDTCTIDNLSSNIGVTATFN
jgi:hypothetical protein